MTVQNSRIKRGLLLQAAALLTLYLSALLYAIGWLAILSIAIPLYVASVIVLMKSGAPLRVRLLLSFWVGTIPIGFEVKDRVIVALQRRMVRTEVFLIPAGYRGSVTVSFDDPGGASPVRDHGRAVFKIGANGELQSRDHAPWARLEEVNAAIDNRREFYFVDQAGNRSKIARHREDELNGQPVVYWQISYANFVPVGGVLEESRYRFYTFFVGTPKQFLQPYGSKLQ